MDAKCAACDRTIPDFSRVCEHCGHRTAEQLQLPVNAVSLRGEPEPETVSGSFDFSPGAFDFSSEKSDRYEDSAVESFTTQLDGPTADVELPMADFLAEASEPAAAVENLSEHSVVVSENGLLFGAPATPVSAAPSEPPARSKRRDIVFVTLAAAVSGVLTLGWLLARSAPGAEVAVAAATGSTSATAVPAEKPARSAHKWNSANSAVWAGDLKSAIAFELEAENPVGVWMRTVRPALVVRCSAGTIEAFVFTASAARIEPQTDDHTVQVSFDGASESTDRWRDSEEHDALFAPDGVAFVRQLLAARVMRFGFTPHNAAPASVEFNVAGLSAALAPASRQCGPSNY